VDGFEQIAVDTTWFKLTIDYTGHITNETTDSVHARVVEK